MLVSPCVMHRQHKTRVHLQRRAEGNNDVVGYALERIPIGQHGCLHVERNYAGHLLAFRTRATAEQIGSSGSVSLCSFHASYWSAVPFARIWCEIPEGHGNPGSCLSSTMSANSHFARGGEQLTNRSTHAGDCFQLRPRGRWTMANPTVAKCVEIGLLAA
jgi:hypothetical protein